MKRNIYRIRVTNFPEFSKNSHEFWNSCQLSGILFNFIILLNLPIVNIFKILWTKYPLRKNLCLKTSLSHPHSSILKSIHPSVCPCIHASIHPSIHPSINLSIHSSIHPCLCKKKNEQTNSTGGFYICNYKQQQTGSTNRGSPTLQINYIPTIHHCCSSLKYLFLFLQNSWIDSTWTYSSSQRFVEVIL